nr:hypothetical protein [Halobacteriovoraceae bacterium]
MEYSSKLNRLNRLAAKLPAGKVYRACDFSKFSTSVSRDLKEMVDKGYLSYLGKGMYYRPKKLGKFEVPPSREELLAKFLKTKDFMVRNVSDFNSLRLGTTQLFNEVYVYNKRRAGTVKLGKTTYHFKKKNFPSKNYDEYLLVDMLNNLERLGENRETLLQNLERRWSEDLNLNKNVVLLFAKKYGKYWVKQYLGQLGGKE